MRSVKREPTPMPPRLMKNLNVSLPVSYFDRLHEIAIDLARTNGWIRCPLQVAILKMIETYPLNEVVERRPVAAVADKAPKRKAAASVRNGRTRTA